MVLVVLSWDGLFIDELLRVDLIRLVEELHWLSKLLDLDCGDLMHLLEFVDVDLELQRPGQDHEQVFARFNTIRVIVTISKTAL